MTGQSTSAAGRSSKRRLPSHSGRCRVWVEVKKKRAWWRFYPQVSSTRAVSFYSVETPMCYVSRPCPMQHLDGDSDDSTSWRQPSVPLSSLAHLQAFLLLCMWQAPAHGGVQRKTSWGLQLPAQISTSSSQKAGVHVHQISSKLLSTSPDKGGSKLSGVHESSNSWQ